MVRVDADRVGSAGGSAEGPSSLVTPMTWPSRPRPARRSRRRRTRRNWTCASSASTGGPVRSAGVRRCGCSRTCSPRWGPRARRPVRLHPDLTPTPDKDAPPSEWRWHTAGLSTQRRATAPGGERAAVARVPRRRRGRRPVAEAGRANRWRSPASKVGPVGLLAAGPTAGASLRRGGCLPHPSWPARNLGPVAATATTATSTVSSPAATPPAVSVYAATGEPRWVIQTGATLAGVASSVVLVTRGQDVVALDADDGTFRWSTPFAHPHGVETRAVSRSHVPLQFVGDVQPHRAWTPTPPPACSMNGMTERGTATLPTGETLRFAETAEDQGRRSM